MNTNTTGQKILQGEWSQGTTWEFILTDTMPRKFLVTAVSGIAFLDDKIILTNTRRGWELPGGHVEAGESLSESLRREMNEETGITVVNEVLFGYIHVHNKIERYSKSTGKAYPEHSYIPHYFVSYEGGPGKCIGEDAFDSKAFELFDPEIMNCNNFEIIRIAFALYFSQNKD